MPNQYSPDPQSRHYKISNKWNLTNAVLCVKGKKITYREAAQVHISIDQ